MVEISIQDIPKITKEELKRLLIVGTHLHQWQGYGYDGLRSVFREYGFIQIDPLNPAGRNHDFFFFARIPDYKQGNLEKILYPEGLVFENFFQMMCFIHRDHFPLFYSTRNEVNLHPYYQKQIQYIKNHHPDYLNDGLKILLKHGPQTSTALKELGDAALGKSRWKEGIFKTNLFELLYHMGQVAIVGRDRNFNKLYDLIERKYSTEELNPKSYSPSSLFQERMKLYQKAFPVADSRISITKTGKLKLSKARDAMIRTHEHLEELTKVDSNSMAPTLVHFEETDRIYLVRAHWKNIIENIEYDEEMRGIGPLDPFTRDRTLTRQVLDFDYHWEIYTPENRRQWGYYLLPLLYKGRLIGRIEPSIKVKDSILRFPRFYSESNTVWTNSMTNALENLLLRWKAMVNATELDLRNITPLV